MKGSAETFVHKDDMLLRTKDNHRQTGLQREAKTRCKNQRKTGMQRSQHDPEERAGRHVEIQFPAVADISTVLADMLPTCNCFGSRGVFLQNSLDVVWFGVSFSRTPRAQYFHQISQIR